LLPLQDTNDIIKIIKEKSSKEIIKAIKEEKIRYIEGKERVHAEMKIISELCKNNKQEFEYIGIAKLACCPC
jgi:hypothetical protein